MVGYDIAPNEGSHIFWLNLWKFSNPLKIGAWDVKTAPYPQKGKGKVFPYSLPSVGPGADPGVQAVSPQVT